MAKQKLTRKSYKRNLIVFGLMLFMGIALVSTGFATWVLSQQTNTTAGGNVEVGIVSDNELKITDLKYYTVYNGEGDAGNKEVSKDNLEFNFEPELTDTTGRVKNEGVKEDGSPKDGVKYEQMSLYIVGKIAPTTFIDDFNVKVTLPLGVEKAIDDGAIALDATTAKYAAKDSNGLVIGADVIVDGVKQDGFNADNIEVIKDSEEDTYLFTIKIGFVWGSDFGGQNPGIYYDEHEIGKGTSYSDVKTALQNLRSAVHGCSYISFEEKDYELYEIGDDKYAYIRTKDPNTGVFKYAYYKVNKLEFSTGVDDEDHEYTYVSAFEVASEASNVKPETPKFEITITVTAK